jgi:hypothetical protein
MKKSSPPTAIIEIEGKKNGSPVQKDLGFFTLRQRNEDFTSRDIDCKDFRTMHLSKSKPKSPAMKTLHTLPGRGRPPF